MKRTTRNAQRGQVLVLTAFALVGLLGFLGLVVDVGYMYLERAKLQKATDAAALAGAALLPDSAQATAEALQYVTTNGESAQNATVTVGPDGSGRTTITVRIAKTVPTFFAKVLGISSFPVSASAGGALVTASGPFDYAIFSGSTAVNLSITGGGWIARGSIHANRSLNLTGGGFTVTGAAEAAQQVNIVGGGYSIGSIKSYATVIDMPDLSASIAAAAAASGQVYNGNKTITGGGFILGNTMYVKGNLNVTGGGFTSTGALLADGDITLNGGGITIGGSNQVAFYSKNGNITFTGGGASFNGVLYAPNGRITITGGGLTFNGSIVAKEVVFTGGGVNVNRTNYPITSLPISTVSLVH